MSDPNDERATVDVTAEGLRVAHVTQVYSVRKRGGVWPSKASLVAVDDVSLDVPRGTVLGLVGESGCGKSTLGRMLIGMEAPRRGTISFAGRTLSSEGADPAWRQEVQMIFQDPYGSLPPRMQIGAIVGEPLQIHGLATRATRSARVRELLAQVDLPADFVTRYPHELSGGQRQRIAIARALAVSPSLLVCDEPTSALDVSVQATVLRLFETLRRDLALTYVFISHDLGVVRRVADHVAVMYLGQIVERGPAAALYERSRHPYTRALLTAVPSLRRRAPQRSSPAERGDDLPSPLQRPRGCPYHPRCPLATSICREQPPALRDVGKGQLAACHHADKVPERLELSSNGSPTPP